MAINTFTSRVAFVYVTCAAFVFWFAVLAEARENTAYSCRILKRKAETVSTSRILLQIRAMKTCFLVFLWCQRP